MVVNLDLVVHHSCISSYFQCMTVDIVSNIYFWGHRPGAMSAADGQRNRNASSSEIISPPGVGTTVNQGVEQRGMGGETEQIAGIN